MKLLLFICVCLFGYTTARQALHPHKRADAAESSTGAPSANGTSPPAVQSPAGSSPIPVNTQPATTGQNGGIFGSVIKAVPCFFITSADKLVDGLQILAKAFGLNKRDLEVQKRSCFEQQRKRAEIAKRDQHAKKYK